MSGYPQSAIYVVGTEMELRAYRRPVDPRKANESAWPDCCI